MRPNWSGNCTCNISCALTALVLAWMIDMSWPTIMLVGHALRLGPTSCFSASATLQPHRHTHTHTQRTYTPSHHTHTTHTTHTHTSMPAATSAAAGIALSNQSATDSKAMSTVRNAESHSGCRGALSWYRISTDCKGNRGSPPHGHLARCRAAGPQAVHQQLGDPHTHGRS